MQTSLTYALIEWHALVALLGQPGAPQLSEPDARPRIANAVGRAWLAGQRIATIDFAVVDAPVLRRLRAGLPDAEVLTAVAEAERIVRTHARR